MKLIPDSFALACGHALVSVFGSLPFLRHQVMVILHFVLFVLCLLHHLIKTEIVQLHFFPPALRAEGVSVGLHLKKPHFIFTDGVAEQGAGQLLRLDEYFSRVLLLLGHFDPELLQLFLVDGPHIAEPHPIGVDSGSFGGPLVHFLHVRLLLRVHFQSLYCCLGPQGIVFPVGVALHHPLWVQGRVRFPPLPEFLMALLIRFVEGCLLFPHC